MEREGSKDELNVDDDALDFKTSHRVMDEEEDGNELVHENSSTGVRVYRMSVSDPTGAVSDQVVTGFVAVKVLGGEEPDPECLGRLYNEYMLSRSPVLSKCSAVRSALQNAKRNGSHAICLEWVEGITLREWVISRVAISSRDTIRSTVDLCRVIAGAIAEMHSVGVVHNNITSDHIIVEDRSIGKCTMEATAEEKENGANFSVKIIGLGSAVLLKANDSVFAMEAKQNDLCSLGAILYEILSRECPNTHQNIGHTSQRKASADDEENEWFPPPLQEFERKLCFTGIPQCLAMLVSKLVEPGRGCDAGSSYHSMNEVKHDLDHIIDFPERFLSQDVNPGAANGGTLEFPSGRLYGRTAEVSVISDTFDRIIQRGGRSEMILISGASGTGKTALVRHMQAHLVKRGGLFLTGKFGLHQQVEALSAICAAFADHCEGLLMKGGDDLQRARAIIQEVVGSDGISVLIDFIPVLQRVMGPNHLAQVEAAVGGKEAQQRLTQMFRLFTRAIHSNSQPLVLCLDDLHWGDAASLDLMKSLIVDNENRCLLVASYRDNEVDSSDPLSVCIREIATFGVPVTKIEIQNMTKAAINCLIADTLRVPLSVSDRLAASVHSGTDGNFFFSKQYLRSLHDDGLLRYMSDSESWQWNLDQIEAQNVADSAMGLIVQNITKLPADTRRAIGVAACLGCHCDEHILHLIKDRDSGGGGIESAALGECGLESDQELAEALNVAIDRHLLGKKGTKYYFLHDQICQAALSLIPEASRAQLHKCIGMCIWKQSQQTEIEKYLFVAADHLYLGLSLVAEYDRIDLAQLFLRAGQKAMSLSLFVPASRYLKAGIDLLGACKWTLHYDLSLQLFKLYADAEFCNAGEVGYFVDQILENAKCFDHKLGAYYTLVKALASRGNTRDAVETCFLVLQELGESFPARGSFDLESYALDEWEETRGMLDEFTDDLLITMKGMTDVTKLWAMQFLSVLAVLTYMGEHDYFPFASMRMVQLTISFGICDEESAVGFALYGLILCSQFGDVKRGYQFGQLALGLLERSDSKRRLGLVYTLVYGCINHWTEPLQLSLEPFLLGHRIGLRSGDIEYSLGNFCDYCWHGLQSSVQLTSLEDSLRAVSFTMRECKQVICLWPTLLLWQFVLNLMGRSVNPLWLTGDAMDQKKLEKHWVEIEMEYCLCRLNFLRMWLAFLYGEYALAAELAEKTRNFEIVNRCEFAVSNHAFLDGMISLALARKKGGKKWRIAAEKAMKRVKSWSTNAPCNFHHKVSLLEAELAVLEENWGRAAREYEEGIALAGENGFVLDQALAFERIAVFYFERGDQARASESYDRAYTLYLQWGALGKADHVKHCLLSMYMDESTP